MIDPFSLNDAPVGEPVSVIVGISTQWRRAVDIDSNLFSLKYDFRPYGGSNGVATNYYSLSLSPMDRGYFAVDITPDTIADWSVGRYNWDLIVTRISDSRHKLIDTGEIRIFGTVSDRRSHAEIMVQKIQSVLENRADGDVEGYTIKSRSITKMSVKDLREWREYYLREIENKYVSESIFKPRGPRSDTVKIRIK